MMTKNEMIQKMGKSIGNPNDFNRFPDIEQDAMRYWLLRELIAITPEEQVKLDQVMDGKIKRILR
jgi:hypothetical protein